MFWEILKASKGLPVTDQYAALWGKKIAEAGGWKVTEITGELPLIFLSDGSVLVDYRIHGTSEGAGVETESGEPAGYKLPLTVESGVTENEFPFAEKQTITWGNGTITSDGKGNFSISGEISGNSNTISLTEPYTVPASIEQGGDYCFYIGNSGVINRLLIVFYDADNNVIENWSFNSSWRKSTGYTNMAGNTITKIGFFFSGTGSRTVNVNASPMFSKNVNLTTYISHRYETDYNLYIGSSKLGEEEYVDYESGKVYKYAEPLKIYGWHVDPSISDSANAITYLGDAVGKTPAAMGAETFSYGDWSNAFFMPKPCMVKSDGTVDYYLDPNDYTKKADGTPSDVANASFDGNAMMEWPLIWWKYEAGETEGEGYFYVANRKPDDTYHCWCNYDADDNITEHFYTAIYNGTGTSKMRSISGVTLTSANGNGDTTATQEITRATANNTTDKTEWYIDVWSDRMLINGLLILMGKSLNSQAVFGRGLDTGSQTAKEAYVTGSLNDKGLFWGNTSAGTSGVKVFGMENYWGCVWHRTAGLIGLSNGNTAYKLTYGTVDGTTADGYNTNGNGYLVDTTARPEGGYFKTAKFGKFGYLPLTIGGSTTTYYSDYWYTNNSALTFAIVGGDANVGVRGGGSFFALNYALGNANWRVSSSLSFKPLAKTVPEPDLTPTDPPVPLPPIPTYKGENTLSSTETLGEVTVKGRIKEVDS